MPKSKSFKQLVTEFSTAKPDFTPLIPYLTGEVKEDLKDFRGDQVGKWGAIKTLWQLSQLNDPERSRRTKSRSRVWKSPHAYKFLVQWTNAVLLRLLIRKFTDTLPRSEYRTKTQLDDAGRSIVSNIEEGWKRPTTSEYLQFLGYSQASLEEVGGDTNKCLQDGFLRSIPGSKVSDLGINLVEWKKFCSNPKNSTKLLYFPLQSSKYPYRILEEVKGENLTYEMFIELINKTDWNLRKLVESLEEKQNKENKFYQVEQSRLRGNIKGR